MLLRWKAMPLMPCGSFTKPSFSYMPTTPGSAYKQIVWMSSVTSPAVSRSTSPRPNPPLCQAGCTWDGSLTINYYLSPLFDDGRTLVAFQMCILCS